MKYLELNPEQQLLLLDETHKKTKLLEVVVEKDEWVTAVIRALFSLPYAEHLLFKGGTSLSKCWHIIERFSEDSTKDPVIVEIQYKSVLEGFTYINPVVKLEIGCRSMHEPFEKVQIQSLIDETFSNTPFSDKPFEVNAVLPQRTFIEKLCLLQEEFAKSQELVRINRMSRHLYDIVKITDTDIVNKALANKDLWVSIVEHRQKFVKMKNFDYGLLKPQNISIIPPGFVISQWQQDYETMRETMIYGESLPFNTLIDTIKQLNERINRIEW